MHTNTIAPFFVRSYLVLTAGFFFAPYRPGSDPEESGNVFGPMVTVRTLSESWRLFWSVP
jgi:Ca2+:H+ antiporter